MSHNPPPPHLTTRHRIIPLNHPPPNQLQIPLHLPITRILNLHTPQLGQRGRSLDQTVHPRWIFLSRFGEYATVVSGLGIFGVDGIEAGDFGARFHGGECGCGGVGLVVVAGGCVDGCGRGGGWDS
eukprot:scaffold2779_cov77-Alexandrium_tamarense.AAC.1